MVSLSAVALRISASRDRDQLMFGTRMIRQPQHGPDPIALNGRRPRVSVATLAHTSSDCRDRREAARSNPKAPIVQARSWPDTRLRTRLPGLVCRTHSRRAGPVGLTFACTLGTQPSPVRAPCGRRWRLYSGVIWVILLWRTTLSKESAGAWCSSLPSANSVYIPCRRPDAKPGPSPE